MSLTFWGLTALFIIFIIIGIILIVVSRRVYASNKKCTLRVEAECVRLNTSHTVQDRARTYYSPVWSFEYNGVTKELSKDISYYNDDQSKMPHVGDRKILMVDPETLKYYEGKPFDTMCKFFMIFGILSIVTGLTGLGITWLVFYLIS